MSSYRKLIISELNSIRSEDARRQTSRTDPPPELILHDFCNYFDSELLADKRLRTELDDDEIAAVQGFSDWVASQPDPPNWTSVEERVAVLLAVLGPGQA